LLLNIRGLYVYSCAFDSSEPRWNGFFLPETNSVVQFVGTCQGLRARSTTPILLIALDELNSDIGTDVYSKALNARPQKRKISEHLTDKYVIIRTFQCVTQIISRPTLQNVIASVWYVVVCTYRMILMNIFILD
jgi:hypothetical protein